jgi:hypothetical protein
MSPSSARSVLRPDFQGAVPAAVLQETWLLERETHGLSLRELPEATHFDVGEVDETAAGHLRRVDHAPPFLNIEPLDYSRYRLCLPGGLPRHGLIVPVVIGQGAQWPVTPRPAEQTRAIPDPVAAISHPTTAFDNLMASADAFEGPAAFAPKRAPRWRNR